MKKPEKIYWSNLLKWEVWVSTFLAAGFLPLLLGFMGGQYYDAGDRFTNIMVAFWFVSWPLVFGFVLTLPPATVEDLFNFGDARNCKECGTKYKKGYYTCSKCGYTRPH